MTPESRLADSRRFCDEVARREARNFHLAFRLLPRAERSDMGALYAFMRRTDDLADEGGAVEEKYRALAAWRRDLDVALDGGAPGWPGLLALADTARRASIPRELLHEVVDGVEMDVEPRRFADFDALADYCHHVASAVGLCCIRIWGYRSDGGRAERLAERCGLALQLTNILRDVGEDAANGRVYLPEDDLRRFGVADADLRAASPSESLRRLMEEYARKAYALYDEADALTDLIDPVGKPVLITIKGIYRALLDEIAKREYDVLASRIRVPKWRKVAVALRSLPSRYAGGKPPREPDLVS